MSQPSSPRTCIRFQKLASLAKTTLLAISLSLAGPAHGAPDDIDTSDALIIGTYKLSAYRVDKNYRRYITSIGHQEAGGTAPEATRAWFTRFLAEQVLIAEALKEGYGERPEVTNEVRRMERHMLTQFAGPFYEHLYSASPPPPVPEASFAYRQSSLDVEILRVPKSAPIARQINNSFLPIAAGDPELDLAAITTSGQSEYFSGPLAWPFEPFEEITNALASAPPGRWQKLDIDDALLVFRVRSVRPLPLPPDRQVGPPPEVVKHRALQRLQKERQRRIVREAGLTFDWPAAQRWVDQLTAQCPDPLLPLDHAAAAEMLTTPLASFHDREASETVTVADYITHYNDLYLRRLPRNALDVFYAVQEMIAARRDYNDARKMGIDREPQFVEDRRNYRDLLALELYVNERVRPALGISDRDIARFYEANIPAFTRPTRIEGTILTFSEVGDAVAVAQAPDSDRAKDLSSHAQNRKTLVLTPTTELPELSFLPGLVFSGQTARVLGPFPNNGTFAVWILERVIDSETRPLKAVSQEIRTRLEDPNLESYKAELARKLSQHTPVEDKIAYKKYGIDELITKPWSL